MSIKTSKTTNYYKENCWTTLFRENEKRRFIENNKHWSRVFLSKRCVFFFFGKTWKNSWSARTISFQPNRRAFHLMVLDWSTPGMRSLCWNVPPRCQCPLREQFWPCTTSYHIHTGHSTAALVEGNPHWLGQRLCVCSRCTFPVVRSSHRSVCGHLGKRRDG